MNSETVRKKHQDHLFPAVKNYYEKPGMILDLPYGSGRRAGYNTAIPPPPIFPTQGPQPTSAL